MPRLLVFAPCDNVIISKDTETISLISILSSIRFTPPPAGPPVPENAVGPMRWFIFAHWVAEEDDIGKTFEQEVKLVRKDGQPVVKALQEFTCEKGKPHQRVAAGFLTFPILSEGMYDLTIDMREKGSEEWKEINRYPLDIGQIGAEVKID